MAYTVSLDEDLELVVTNKHSAVVGDDHFR